MEFKDRKEIIYLFEEYSRKFPNKDKGEIVLKISREVGRNINTTRNVINDAENILRRYDSTKDTEKRNTKGNPLYDDIIEPLM